MSNTVTLEPERTYDHEAAAERIAIAPCGTSMRAVINGITVAKSDRALLLQETGYPPRVYFPADDVRMELLTPSMHTTHCPFKGEAAYWSLNAGGASIGNGAWAYPEPIGAVAEIKNHLSFADEVQIEG